MSLPNNFWSRVAAGAAAIAAVAVAGSAMAQSMVVRATGPSAAKYPTGSRVKDADPIRLVAGDRVVLIKDGKTRSLSGPGTFRAGDTVSESQNSSTAVTRMLAKGPTMRSRGGFSRGADEAALRDARAPNLWLLDYREAGTFCVADSNGLLLWRPEMDSDQLLRIEHDGKSETVAFIAGANYRKWPSETFPIQTGSAYTLSGGGLSAPVSVRFTALDGEPATIEATMEALSAKGCTSQLNRLAETLAQ